MAKQPKIRFKGFTEEWKEGKIGDAFCERDEHTGNGELLSVTINSGIRRAVDMERTFATGDLSKYKVVQKGDIAYNTMRMWQGACGVSEYLGIVSPAYTIATPKDEQDSAFYAYYFKSNKMLHDFRINSQGLTSDTWNLRYPVFASIDIHYPNKQEQKEIANFLRTIDSTISQREKELEKLKNIKRALLERMFPQDGQNTPSIRFNGFTDEWEEKKADDIFISFDERNHPELPVLAATQDKGMVIREEIGYKIAHNTSNEVGYKHVLPGQFVIHLRSFQGGFAHSNVEGITSPAYDVFGLRNPEKHDDCFWKYIFCSSWFIKRLVTVTYGIRDGRNVSYNEFLGLSFMVPSKQEQIRIAKLFKTLGEQISLRERQLTLLKHTKQALLEQMFVNE